MTLLAVQREIAGRIGMSRDYFNPSPEAIPLLGVQPTVASSLHQHKSIIKKGLNAGKKVLSTGASVAEKLGVIPGAEPISVPLKSVQAVVQVRRWVRAKHHALQLAVYWELAKEEDSQTREGTADAIAYAVAQKETHQNRNGLRSIIPSYDKLINAMHRVAKDNRGVDRSHYARILRSNAMLGDYYAQLAIAELVGSNRYDEATNPGDTQGKGIDLIKAKLKS